MNNNDRPREHLSLDRLKALTDGVVAIVLTILVLDLDVPPAHDFSDSGLLAFLGRLEHQTLPYTASFALVAGHWIVHHAILESIRTTDRTFLWLNFAFLLPLTLVPYLTEMRAEYSGALPVAALFSTVQVTCCLMLLMIWHYALRHLRESPVKPAIVRSFDIRIILAISLNILGMLAVPVSERVATVLFVCVPLLFMRHHTFDKRPHDAKAG